MLKRKIAVFLYFPHQLLEPPSANCAKFSCESNRDGLKCQNLQKWAKMGPKIFRFWAEFSVNFLGCAQSKDTLPCWPLRTPRVRKTRFVAHLLGPKLGAKWRHRYSQKREISSPQHFSWVFSAQPCGPFLRKIQRWPKGLRMGTGQKSIKIPTEIHVTI